MVIGAARNGLIYISRDGGASWNNIPFPAEFRGVLHALEVDPRTDGTWYAGVEGDHSFSSGVYKTIDGGRTWSQLPDMTGRAVWSLALWPENPDVVAAGTADGVYRSDSAGDSWSRISSADDTELRPVVSLAFHPLNKEVLYAGTTHLPWRTMNGGASWESIHTGMIDDSDVFSIQVDLRDPQLVYASACSGVYASSDAASHWRKLTTPVGAFRTYFVSAEPERPAVIFAGTSVGLLRSEDAGRIFRIVSPQAIKSIAFDPAVPNRIFFASTTAGMMVSTDEGRTLREANFGFANRNFTALTGAGTVLYANSVYEGSGGVYRTDANPIQWVRTGEPAGQQILLMSAAPDKPSTVFASGYHGLLKSNDGGRSWTPLPKNAGGQVTSLLAIDSTTLLLATDRGVFRSSGANWRPVTPAGARGVQYLNRSGKSVITALAEHDAFASLDYGLTWKACGNPTPSTAWYGLAFDFSSAGLAGTALAATSEGLFRSEDSCESWIKVTAGVHSSTVSVVLFHPAHPGEAYAAQGGEVFRSDDGGLHWLPLDPGGERNVWPMALIVLPADRGRLFALCPRRGIFSNTVDGSQPAAGQ